MNKSRRLVYAVHLVVNPCSRSNTNSAIYKTAQHKERNRKLQNSKQRYATVRVRYSKAQYSTIRNDTARHENIYSYRYVYNKFTTRIPFILRIQGPQRKTYISRVFRQEILSPTMLGKGLTSPQAPLKKIKKRKGKRPLSMVS